MRRAEVLGRERWGCYSESFMGNPSQALTNSHGTRAFRFDLTKVATADLEREGVEGFGVFSSMNRRRQWGWMLKFPESFLTVPVIGRSHWSQIIRILFTSTRKQAPTKWRSLLRPNTSHARVRVRSDANENGEQCGETLQPGVY